MNPQLWPQEPPLPHYFGPEHQAFRAALRTVVSRHITPHVAQWEAQGQVPLSAHKPLAEVGALGLGFDESLGGTPCDSFMKIVLAEELARCGAGGVCAALGSHTIGLPPVALGGSPGLKQRVISPVLRGEAISALAVTEPGGGSDVAALRTSAIRQAGPAGVGGHGSQDHYLLNGEKTFITSGLRAHFITVAVRTQPESRGAQGISVLLVDGNSEGLERTGLEKMGWWASDTAHLRFTNCKVPVANLIGTEHQGFRLLMHNFNGERLFMAAQAASFAQLCYEEALAWARERKTFGQALAEHQVVRHKLVDMALRIHAARSLIYELAYRLDYELAQPAQLVARTAMAKIVATQAMQFCADQGVQLLGAMGFMRGTVCERLYREVKVMMIGGGSEEIMKDLAAKQMGLT